MAQEEWWKGNEFFGPAYIEGDDSKEGYLEEAQDLQTRTWNEVNGVIRLCNISPGDRVLDLPCGYGRHSAELARRRFDVTGVDLNEDHLNIARQTAKGVRFIQEDMRKIDFGEEFDAAINMFYSFGFFPSDEENRAVLDRFHRALKPGGRFLMHTDVNIPRIIAGKYKTDETRRLRSGRELIVKDRYDPVTHRIEGSWTIDGDTREYSVRVFTQEEFEQWCLDAGFSHCKTFSSWNGEEYSPDAEDMMVVATK